MAEFFSKSNELTLFIPAPDHLPRLVVLENGQTAEKYLPDTKINFQNGRYDSAVIQDQKLRLWVEAKIRANQGFGQFISEITEADKKIAAEQLSLVEANRALAETRAENERLRVQIDAAAQLVRMAPPPSIPTPEELLARATTGDRLVAQALASDGIDPSVGRPPIINELAAEIAELERSAGTAPPEQEFPSGEVPVAQAGKAVKGGKAK